MCVILLFTEVVGIGFKGFNEFLCLAIMLLLYCLPLGNYYCKKTENPRTAKQTQLLPFVKKPETILYFVLWFLLQTIKLMFYVVQIFLYKKKKKQFLYNAIRAKGEKVWYTEH